MKSSLNKPHRIIYLITVYPVYMMLLLLLLTGCSKSNQSGNSSQTDSGNSSYITKTSVLLDTVCTITIYDKQVEAILDDCFDLINKYQLIYSDTDPNSELYQLNNGLLPHDGLTYQVSDELSDILLNGLYYSKLSGGRFDITIEPLTSLWNFKAVNPVLPNDADIKKAIPLVNYQNLTLDGNKVTFAQEGMGIDLGGIAKGYIADKLKELLLSEGVNSAIINLGGNVLCIGTKPDKTPFNVGIQKPFADRSETIAIMKIDDLSVVSSGVYERFFKINNVLYHHILDPKTGYPYDNGLIAVTIISMNSVDGDGLSTTCFALGLDAGLELIAGTPDTYAAFITSDYQVHYSKGFEAALKLVSQ